LTVEGLDLEAAEIDRRQTTDVDIDLVRVTTWHIEGVDATLRTKEVLGLPGIETVLAQVFPAAEQLETLRLHDQMQESLAPADRTVAVQDARILKVRGDLEGHVAAMTATRISLHRFSDT
jgi:hypothetical protein